MARTMSAREARANFGDLLGSVYYTKEPVVVEKKGKPYAVVVSPEDYETLQRIKRRGFAVIEALQDRNADKDPDEVLSDVTALVEEVRQELRDQEKPAGRRR
jgi:prevent-host-death family protein